MTVNSLYSVDNDSFLFIYLFTWLSWHEKKEEKEKITIYDIRVFD